MPNGSAKTKVIAPRTTDGHAPIPRNAYEPSVRTPLKFAKTGRTEQSHKRACDINSIMAKYQKTGAIKHLNAHPPKYGDATGPDFTAAQFLVAEQTSIFEELPSKLRRIFKNDPAEYLNFVVDPANADFLEKEGLAGLLPSDEETYPETADEDVSPAPPEEEAPSE